jgi:hypothetical protein
MDEVEGTHVATMNIEGGSKVEKVLNHPILEGSYGKDSMVILGVIHS